MISQKDLEEIKTLMFKCEASNRVLFGCLQRLVNQNELEKEEAKQNFNIVNFKNKTVSK